MIINYTRASLVAQMVKNLPALQETWVWSLGWEDPLEKGKATHSVFWPREIHGLYSSWGRKELDSTEQVSLSLFTFFLEGSLACSRFLSRCVLSILSEAALLEIILSPHHVYFLYYTMLCNHLFTPLCRMQAPWGQKLYQADLYGTPSAHAWHMVSVH